MPKPSSPVRQRRCRGTVYSAASILDWRHCLQTRGLDEYGYCWQHREQGDYERELESAYAQHTAVY